MSQVVTKSVENLLPCEWTEYTRIALGGRVAYIVNVECSDRTDDGGWYVAALLSDAGVLYTRMTAGPISAADFEAIVDAWLCRVVD